ncbi:MAG: hypothetical protein Q6L68_13770, partial [Thermostichus sp. DG02_5_bins_236]
GSFKLKGTRDLNFDQLEPIHRVRVVRRSDGYYAQIVLEVERTEKHDPTKKAIAEPSIPRASAVGVSTS